MIIPDKPLPKSKNEQDNFLYKCNMCGKEVKFKETKRHLHRYHSQNEQIEYFEELKNR